MPRSPLLQLPLQGVCKRTSTGTGTDARKKSGDFGRSRASCKPSCDTCNLPATSLCSASNVNSARYQTLTAFLLSSGEIVSDGLFPDVSSAAPAPQAVNQYEQEVAANLHAQTRVGIASDTCSMLAGCKPLLLCRDKQTAKELMPVLQRLERMQRNAAKLQQLAVQQRLIDLQEPVTFATHITKSQQRRSKAPAQQKQVVRASARVRGIAAEPIQPLTTGAADAADTMQSEEAGPSEIIQEQAACCCITCLSAVNGFAALACKHIIHVNVHEHSVSG